MYEQNAPFCSWQLVDDKPYWPQRSFRGFKQSNPISVAEQRYVAWLCKKVCMLFIHISFVYIMNAAGIGLLLFLDQIPNLQVCICNEEHNIVHVMYNVVYDTIQSCIP